MKKVILGGWYFKLKRWEVESVYLNWLQINVQII